MSQGLLAYESFVRIHDEMGHKSPPAWDALSRLKRIAWEAAAQAVALAVLPLSIDPFQIEDEDEDEDDEGEDEVDEVSDAMSDQMRFESSKGG